MTTDTTRRTFIQGTSAAVAALSLPSAALAGSSPWETAKANYATAHAELMRRIDLHWRAELFASEFTKNAPAPLKISYEAGGFTSDNGLVTMKAHRTSYTLKHYNYRGPNVPSELANHPDYIEYRRKADAWRNDPAYIKAKADVKSSNDFVVEFHDVEDGAYAALISTPVSTLDQLGEKVAMGCENSMGDETRMRELLKAVSGDLARLTGKQQVAV